MIVAAVGPYMFDEGEQRARDLEQWSAAVPVLDVGRMRLDQQRSLIGFHQCMALPPLDLRSGIAWHDGYAFHGWSGST